MITFDILTIFPGFCTAYLQESLIQKAIQKKILNVKVHNLRAWAQDTRGTVDGKPYGGGLGMVFHVDPVARAVKELGKGRILGRKMKFPKGTEVILFTPRGKPFTQKTATSLSKKKHIVFVCGRYEGVDERVADHIATMKLSLGSYDLMGGELPALVVLETVSRLVPGVILQKDILKERRTKGGGFVEYPQYTRPESYIPKKGVSWKVPKVLLSGNHKRIASWREKRKKIIET
jgi:tRNA (guanine37-N1)-methyltransferase